jgi:hypothetical protein
MKISEIFRRKLNVVSVLAFFVSCILGILSNSVKLSAFCYLIMGFSFIVFVSNIFLNKNRKHVEGLHFFDFNKGDIDDID